MALRRAWLLAFVLLSGCAGLSVDQSTAISCRSYAATLSSLAELRAADELSAEQVAAVDELRVVGNSICLDHSADASELSTLSDVLRGMSRIQAEASQ